MQFKALCLSCSCCLVVLGLSVNTKQRDTLAISFRLSRGSWQGFKSAQNNFDRSFSLIKPPSLFGNLLGETAIKVIHVTH